MLRPTFFLPHTPTHAPPQVKATQAQSHSCDDPVAAPGKTTDESHTDPMTRTRLNINLKWLASQANDSSTAAAAGGPAPAPAPAHSSQRSPAAAPRPRPRPHHSHQQLGRSPLNRLWPQQPWRGSAHDPYPPGPVLAPLHAGKTPPAAAGEPPGRGLPTDPDRGAASQPFSPLGIAAAPAGGFTPGWSGHRAPNPPAATPRTLFQSPAAAAPGSRPAHSPWRLAGRPAAAAARGGYTPQGGSPMDALRRRVLRGGGRRGGLLGAVRGEDPGAGRRPDLDTPTRGRVNFFSSWLGAAQP